MLKAESPMNSREDGSVSGALATPLKAMLPMVLTLSGICSVLILRAKKKAVLPMDSSPSGKVTDVVLELK